MQAIKSGLARYGPPELAGNVATLVASFLVGRQIFTLGAGFICLAEQAAYYTTAVVRGLCESRGGFL